MLASFGGDVNGKLEHVMNAALGGLLSVSIFGIAAYMVVHGFKKRLEPYR